MPRSGRHRRIVIAFAIVVCAAAFARLPVSGAAFVAHTSSDGNGVAALSVAPPGNVTATMTVNILPLLTCRVSLSWTASTTPDVNGYEIVRVVASSGAVAAGPWTTTGLTFIDNPVPLQLIGSAYEWKVRAMLSNWRSPWQTAAPDNLLACLL
jgi:hypothetical protein